MDSGMLNLARTGVRIGNSRLNCAPWSGPVRAPGSLEAGLESLTIRGGANVLEQYIVGSGHGDPLRDAPKQGPG